MKFGSSILQGSGGIQKGKCFFSWRWHHLLILPLWWTVSSNKPRSNITLYLQDCVTKWLLETGAVLWNDRRNTDGIIFFFSSNRFVPDVWILIISLGLSSRHNIDFCLMGESESENPSRDGIYRKCFASSSKSVKAEPEIPNFQMSLWLTLCSGPNFYLPGNWQTGKFICVNMW